MHSLTKVLASVVGLICFGTGVNAAAQPRILEHIEWKSFPSGEQMARAFPDKAMRYNKSGWAVLECRLTAKGGLELCQVLGEQPNDYGFGEAALRLAPRFKFAATSDEEGPMEGSYIRVPLVLRANGVEPPPFNHRAGEPSVLVSPAKPGAKRTFACATQAEPEQKCQAHSFTWAKMPKLEETASLIRSAGEGPGISSLTCQVGAGSLLINCVTSENQAARRSAMLGLVPLFIAPDLTTDKVPTGGGLIAIDFDWPALRKAVDTSIMSPKAP